MYDGPDVAAAAAVMTEPLGRSDAQRGVDHSPAVMHMDGWGEVSGIPTVGV